MRAVPKIKFFLWISRAGWLALVVATFILLVAAMRARNNQVCRSVRISLEHGTLVPGVEKADILSLLQGAHLNPRGKYLRTVDALSIQRTVESDPWISHAQVYVDNANVLHIRAILRDPVVRIFTKSGNSYYLDSAANILPLPAHFRPTLPVFTNFPSGFRKSDPADSLLGSGVISLGRYLETDSFWNAQAQQINMLNDNDFELIPRVGNQVIILGDGTDLPAKFNKLLAFYHQVQNVQGWEKYDTINLSYKNEIVAVRRPARKGQEAADPHTTTRLDRNLNTAAIPASDVPAGMRKHTMPVKLADKVPKAIYTPTDSQSSTINTTKNNRQP
jgi:cell division protein FtsQ